MIEILNKKAGGLLLCTLLLTGVCSLYGQGSEVGGGIGGLYYTGDLSRSFNIKAIRPAATLFYRYNISEPVSFRASVTAGNLVGWDEYTPVDPFAERRDASFETFLFEVSGVFEYHFLKWRQENFPVRWTPYVFGGIAMFGFTAPDDKVEDYSQVQPSLPFGLGAKYILNPKWYVGAEIGARKTFTDYLDNVSQGDGVNKDYSYGNEFNSDLYYYAGISITYSFYSIPCPVSPYSRKYRQRR